MSAIVVTKENFEEIKNSEKTVLLDFYADWCGPCRMVAPIVAQIAEECPQYTVGKINVDNDPEIARVFNVESIPLVAFVKNNTYLDMSVGYVPKASLVKKIEENK